MRYSADLAGRGSSANVSDEDVMKDFVRTTGSVVEVRVISWDGPHAPKSEWAEFEALPADPTHEQLEAAKKRALADNRYFRRCGKCGSLKPTGWMRERGLCQSCAEGLSGVIP